MALPAGYSKVRLTDVEVVLNVQNEIVGFIDADGTESAIASYAKNAAGEITGFAGPGGIDALAALSRSVVASRDAILSDSGNLLKCNSGSAIVITIQADATTLWSANEAIALYQAGAGAASFTAGAGVTFRGTVPTPAQYSTIGIHRVGVNEWAFL